MSKTLSAGAAKRPINPRLGTGKAGLRLFGEPIQAVESDLLATAVVLDSGDAQVALLAIDLCVMSTGESDALRQAVADALGIERSHVMLNLSHNHASPALPGFMWMTDTPAEAALRERYRRELTEALVAVAREAQATLRPARIGTGWGTSDIGVYRREWRGTRDILGQDLEHPIDRSVGVVRIDDLDGRPISVLFRYSAHPVTVGPFSQVVSADYPGPARDVVERSLGGVAIFLQGCGGNVNPLVGIGYEVDCSDTKDRVGIELGGEVLKVAAQIRTNTRAGERTTLGSVPNILVTPWVDVDECQTLPISVAESSLTLRFGALPPLEQAQAIHRHWQEVLSARTEGGAQLWEVRVARKYENWSRLLVEAVEQGDSTVELPMQVIRIGELALVALSAEVFYETGLDIQAQSPFADTLVLGYTNGLVNYLPRSEDYPDGGWQVDGDYALPDLMPQAWELPVHFHPDSAARATTFATELLAGLHNK